MPICCKRKRKRGKKQNEKKTQKTKPKKTKKQKTKNRLMKVTKIGFLGVRSFFFFVFCIFLVSWFLVFWFVVVFLKGWQNNTKVKDLDLTLCQFSHFRGCKLAFGWFYWLLWACGSIRKPCKKPWTKCRYHWGKLGGLGHGLGNFVCLCNFSKTVLNKCKHIGSQWMCRTDFEIDIVGSNPWVNICSNTLRIPLKRSDASLWSECSLQQVHFF